MASSTRSSAIQTRRTCSSIQVCSRRIGFSSYVSCSAGAHRSCSPLFVSSSRYLARKPELAQLYAAVFPDGVPSPRFVDDHRGVLAAYPRVAIRYASLLRWRRDVIDIEVRRVVERTGCAPKGKDRDKLIRELARNGIAQATIRLANKAYRLERPADELLAVFAVLSPIVTGRDCFLLTADKDVIEQTHRMC